MNCSCGAELVAPARQGRRPSYCSNACRQSAYRVRRKLPASLTAHNRWVRRDGKRPITIKGSPASSTNPATWSTFAEVVTSSAGDGFGVMMGDGLGAYDLDHVTDAEAHAFIATVSEPILYAERSMSGRGVHVFIAADEAAGWKRQIGGVSVERYTRARFIATTGVAFQ